MASQSLSQPTSSAQTKIPSFGTDPRALSPDQSPESESHPIRGQRRLAKEPKLIDLTSLPCVSLPPGPVPWKKRPQRKSAGKNSRAAGRSIPKFTVTSKCGWGIVSQKRLSFQERPDVAFKRIHPTCAGTFWVDPNGRAEGHEGDAAAIQLCQVARHPLHRMTRHPLHFVIGFWS